MLSEKHKAEIEDRATDLAQKLTMTLDATLEPALRLEIIRSAVAEILYAKDIEIAIVGTCRDFWYETYSKASTHLQERVERAVTDAIVLDFANDADCMKRLMKLQDRIIENIRVEFISSGLKSAFTSSLGSLKVTVA